MGNFRREFRQGQAMFGPTEDVTQMMRHTKHLLFKMGNPRWSTTHYQVVHNKVADRPQAKSNIQVMGNFRREFRQGQATFGPTEDVTRMMRHTKHLLFVFNQHGEPPQQSGGHSSVSGGPQQSG